MKLHTGKFFLAAALSGKMTLCLVSLWLAPSKLLAASAPLRTQVSHLGNQPLRFERNLGQYGNTAAFVARGPKYILALSPAEVRVTLQRTIVPADKASPLRGIMTSPAQVSYRSLQIELVGANQRARMTGAGEVAGQANYFIGDDSTKWRTGVPTYDRVRVPEIYPGINLLHYGNQQQLEYDFEIAPGALPGVIAMRFVGADQIAIDPNGDLILQLGGEEIRQPKPVIYQTVRGQRKQIIGGYVLADVQTVKFSIGEYDPDLPLVIDPVVSYSTYLDGLDDDTIWAVAVGDDGDVYLAGETMTAQAMATGGAFQTNLVGVLPQYGDVFVSRNNNAVSSKVYFTYLGGVANEAAFGLAVDSDGNAYVTGYTGSTNFPTTSPAVQTNLVGPIVLGTAPADCFITKIGPSGSNLVFSTFYGGSGTGFNGIGNDVGSGIALDAGNNVYVAGYTYSTNFPTVNTTFTNAGGLEDGFLLKLDAAGTNVIYAMRFGGTNSDYARDVAVDGFGNPLVTGHTASANFPATTNAFQQLLNNTTNPSFADDAFFAKIQSASGTFIYSTLIGGTNSDRGIRLATDASGATYVTGWTLSGDFPRTSTNFQTFVTTNASAADAFVIKLNPNNTNLDYAITFGGTGKDEAWDVAVDDAGQAHVVGATESLNFPTNELFGILRGTNSGGSDAFFAEINSNGTAFVYSAYLGGAANDLGYGVALDAGGNAYFVGGTIFGEFPTQPPTTPGGYTDKDGFIVKILTETSPISLAIAAAGTNVLVSWPGYVPEYTLESRTNILGTNVWNSVTASRVLTNNNYVITLPATNAQRFFRLKR